MNKTVTINLSGQVFQIDEDAYELLKGYLDSIHLRFRNSEGAEEILADIEGRLAEMFQANLSPRKNVVSIQDVDAVIQTMGKPEDFGDVDEAEPTAGNNATTGPSTSTNAHSTNAADKPYRKLFRDEDNKVVGGVLSGLSAYLGLHDPIWLRLIFAILIIVGIGSPVVVYFVMWFLVPKAVTASDKLQMKGEPINIDNIERTIKEDLNDFRNNLNDVPNKPGFQKARTGLASVVAAFLDVLAIFLKLLKGAIGVTLIIIGLSALGFLTWNITIPTEFFSPSPVVIKYFFTSQTQSIIALVGLGLFVFIPFLMLVIWGFRLLLNQRYRSPRAGLGFLGLWIIGIILIIVSVIQGKSDTTYEKEVKEQVNLVMPASKVLHVALLKDDRSNDPYFQFPGNGAVRVEKDMVYGKENIKFTIIKTTDTVFSVEKTYIANGSSREDAIAKAKHITYNIKQTDSVLSLQDYMSFPVADKLRFQEIKVTLMMPEGTSVFLEKGLDAIIYDIKNTKNIYDSNMPDHLWTMTAEGLVCASRCDEFESGKGDWDVVTESFSTVKVNGSFDVTFKKGTKYSYSITAPADQLKHVDVHVDGDMLVINNSKHWDLFNHQIRIEVTTPSLEKIIGNGAAHIKVAGMEAKELDIELNGASHGDITNVKINDLTIHASGASYVHATGKTIKLDVEAVGASHFDGLELTTEDTRAEASGASDADLTVTSKLDAEASGASHIRYKGSPTVSSNATGASSIKPER